MTIEQFKEFREGKGNIQLTFDELASVIVNACNYDPDDYIINHLYDDLSDINISTVKA